MGPKRKASAPPSASASAARGGASPAANPKSPVGTADDDARSWSTLADRVRAHGGVVHANVRVGADASGTRGLVAIGPIAEGATLFRIPEACTLTAASALRSPLGKAIAARAIVAGESRGVERGTGYHAPSRSLPLGDIALAAFVAADSVDTDSPFAAYHSLLRAEGALDAAPTRWPPEQRRTLLRARDVATRADVVSEALRRDAEDAFEALVREPLANHTREKKGERSGSGVEDAFDACDARDAFDAREAFRRALAAVHSRAFNFGEADASDGATYDSSTPARSAREAFEREAAGSALVPLLDCANHHRRPRECAWRAVETSQSRGGPGPAPLAAKTSSSPERVVGGDTSEKWLEVVALRAFVAGDPVRVAYGARSNEHLLTRYGFCVADNVEPDGSSNDETPFFLADSGSAAVPGDVILNRRDATTADGKRIVFLRVATRPEYTFAPFTDALDLFRARARERRRGGGGGGDARSREPRSSAETLVAPDATRDEDFLGAFRGDGDEEDDDACAALMYGSGEESGEASGEEEDARGVMEEENESGEDARVYLEALRDMATSLGRRADALRRAAEETALCVPSAKKRAEACVAYLESERRTFRFFSRAATRAARALGRGDDEEAPEDNEDDEDDEGVAALVAAFSEVRRRNALFV